MTTIVLFGVGSALAVEYEESCRRLGWRIAFGVKNMEALVQCSNSVAIQTPSDIKEKDLALPFLIPLFTPKNRKAALQQAVELGFSLPVTLVDPTAIVASTSRLGAGSFLNAGSVIGAACQIGAHVTINRNCSVGHHNIIGDLVSIGPGCTLCGNVTIEAGALIGAGSVVLPGVRIGANSIIAAGTVLTRDIPPNSIARNKSELAVVQSNFRQKR